MTVDVKAENSEQALQIAAEKFVDARSVGLYDVASGESFWKNLAGKP